MSESGIVNVPHGHTLKRERPPRPRNVAGAQIQAIRETLRPKVSQEDLCGRLAKLGVTLTRTQVAKLENGRRPIFDYELEAIAQALRVPITTLLERSTKPAARRG